MEETRNIDELFATANMDLAREQTQATYPYLRELANFIASGGTFPQPRRK